VPDKIEFIQPNDPDMQKDFYEVWKKIETSIQKYERNSNKQKKNKPANNRTLTNLNFKL
jgi:hypothetical protein